MTDLNNPRDAARAVNQLAGIPDAAAHEEAFTRLTVTGARVGWNNLTQDDFDQAQDAFDDAMGWPRRKRMNPTLWKITFWWHWHVASPVLYPVMNVPGDLARYLHWHLWSKRRGGQTLVAYRADDGEAYLKTMPWTEYRDHRAADGDPIPNEFLRLLTRPFDRFRRQCGYGWDCPPCHIHAGIPGAAFPTEAAATEGMWRHLHDSHQGEVPDGAWIGEITWRGKD